MSIDVRRGIYSKLTGTTAINNAVSGRIYYQQAPAKAAFPYIIFDKQAGTRTRAFQAPNAFNKQVWLIKAVDRNTTADTADTIANLIDTTFNGGTITVTGWTVADLAHLSDVSYPEPDGDQMFHHSGATYTVTLTA